MSTDPKSNNEKSSGCYDISKAPTSSQMDKVIREIRTCKKGIGLILTTTGINLRNDLEILEKKIPTTIDQKIKHESCYEDEKVKAPKKMERLTFEKPLEKPKVLRKFRPPISKYRQKQTEAIIEVQTEKNTRIKDETLIQTQTEVKIEIQNETIIKTQVNTETEIALTEIKNEFKKEPEAKEEIIYFDQVCATELISQKKYLTTSATSSKEPPIAKFFMINAWLAKQQENRCEKYSSVLRKMLTRESLVCTYKCMSKYCSYVTMSTKNFEKHLDCHEKSGEANEYLYFCPYCPYEGNSKTDITSHYREAHDYDKFQCGYCFYRSASCESCWEHCKTHHCKHSKTIPIVYECPLKDAIDNSATRVLLKAKRAKHVKKIQCSREFKIKENYKFILNYFSPHLVCSAGFYLVDRFFDHVLDEHKLDLKAGRDRQTQNGLQEFLNDFHNNKVGKFECLYCDYGTDFRRECLFIS